MKLVIQIPVLNECATIAEVLHDLPRTIPGISEICVLIVDDGCTDDTVAIALANGADHVVRHTSNKGLAAAYQTGIDTALQLGADLIVNIDGDHQYRGSDIPAMVAPILRGQADVVIVDRQVQNIAHFSPLKKSLQFVGSSVVRWASETDVPDTVSGFRALSREAALRTFVTTDFSYTVENLIQAGKRRLTIIAIPITTNPMRRPSKLHQGNWHFVKRQAAIIARTYATYEPLKTFSYIAFVFLALGGGFLLRAIYVFVGRRLGLLSASNDQALLAGSILVLMAMIAFLIGLLADRVGGLQRLLEEVLYRTRTVQVEDEAWRRNIDSRLQSLEKSLHLPEDVENHAPQPHPWNGKSKP